MSSLRHCAPHVRVIPSLVSPSLSESQSAPFSVSSYFKLFQVFSHLRVEFWLKTNSGYPTGRDAGFFFWVIYDGPGNPGPFFFKFQSASCFHLSFLRAPHVFSCVCSQRAPSSSTFSFISFPSLRAPQDFLFLSSERPMSSLAFFLRVPHLQRQTETKRSWREMSV